MLPSQRTFLFGRTALLTPQTTDPGNSIRGQCYGVGAAIPTGGSVDKALDEMQKAHEMIKCITDLCLTEHRGSINAENYSNYMQNIKKNLL